MQPRITFKEFINSYFPEIELNRFHTDLLEKINNHKQETLILTDKVRGHNFPRLLCLYETANAINQGKTVAICSYTKNGMRGLIEDLKLIFPDLLHIEEINDSRTDICFNRNVMIADDPYEKVSEQEENENRKAAEFWVENRIITKKKPDEK